MFNPVQHYEFGKKHWYINTISDLSISGSYNTFFELSFTQPSSTYTIVYYEVYVDGVLNQTCLFNYVMSIKLTESTNYNITIKAVDNKGNKSNNSNTVNGTTTNVTYTDVDALAFISSSAISLNYQLESIHLLVSRLKSNSIWSKMTALYPIVGGSSSSHKFNLKDPRDLDAAYRLSFSGTITHSDNGMLPNGSTGYADTFLNVTTLNKDSNHISFYSRTNNTTSGVDCGTYYAANAQYFYQSLYFVSALAYAALTAPSVKSWSQNKTNGYLISTRQSSTIIKSFHDNVTKLNTTHNSMTMTQSLNIYLFARNEMGAVSFSNRQCAFFSIGSGLTDEDCSNLYSINQKYQTILGRNV